jgi:hypothetical protein
MQKMPSQTDRALVRQARQGNAKTYGGLVQNDQSLVFNVCYRLMGERREEGLVNFIFFAAVALALFVLGDRMEGRQNLGLSGLVGLLPIAVGIVFGLAGMVRLVGEKLRQSLAGI